MVTFLISSLAIFAKISGIIDYPFFRKGWVALFIILFYICLGPIYSIIMHGRYGQTLGKMAFGTKVVKDNGEPITYFTAFIRQLGYLVNMITVIGWFWILFDAKNRGFHDLIAKTILIKCEEKPKIKLIMITAISISFVLMIMAIFVTGGITIEHHHFSP